MDKTSLAKSFGYAFAGIKVSWQSQRNFRIHLAALAFVILLLVTSHPAAIWWAVLLLTSGAVIALELVNTAVEKLIDHVHPDQHDIIKIVKDVLAASVLVVAIAAVGVFVAFLCR